MHRVHTSESAVPLCELQPIVLSHVAPTPRTHAALERLRSKSYAARSRDAGDRDRGGGRAEAAWSTLVACILCLVRLELASFAAGAFSFKVDAEQLP